jgi:protease YdgD
MDALRAHIKGMIRRLCLLALIAAAAASPAASPPAGAAGRPERVPDEDHAQWRAIGRVNVVGFRSGGSCTGTLIAPDRVLTAAHCLFALDDHRPAKPDQVHFVAGWLKGRYAAHSTAVEIRIHPGYRHGKSPDSKSLKNDVAVLRLAGRLPRASVPPLPVNPVADTGGPLSIIGYRRDRPNALTRDADCRALVQNGGVLGLDCEVTFGTSGAPVLAETGDGWAVVGVVSAGNTGPGPVKTIAAPVGAAFAYGP